MVDKECHAAQIFLWGHRSARDPLNFKVVFFLHDLHCELIAAGFGTYCNLYPQCIFVHGIFEATLIADGSRLLQILD